LLSVTTFAAPNAKKKPWKPNVFFWEELRQNAGNTYYSTNSTTEKINEKK
jgi:hypothetical protein